MLIGLGLMVEAVDVHGGRDERAAIRHAIRSPFADLSERNAHALCADFTPSAGARLSDGPNAECETRLLHAFHSVWGRAADWPPREQRSSPGPEVRDIDLHGSRATAEMVYRGEPEREQRLQLQMLDEHWRIATPARIEARSDCPQHDARAGCEARVTMRFAAQ